MIKNELKANNKVISDFAHFQTPHVVRQINQIFFNIVGQHEDFDIKHNIVRQNLSIIIQNMTKLNSKKLPRDG